MDAKRLAKIEETWKEIGCRARPLRDYVFVRTELLPEKIGHIFIPPSQRGNYSQLPHQVLMRALVLSTGGAVKGLKAGDRIAFPRLFFARWHELDDKTLVGWVREDNIHALAEDEAEEAQAQRQADETAKRFQAEAP